MRQIISLPRAFAWTALALPFVEIAGFVTIGAALGLAATLLWTLLSIVLGIALMRRESLDILLRADAASRRRENAAPELVEGGLVALAGLLLIIPGFISDAAGLVLFLPPVRRALARRLAARMRARMQTETGRGPGSAPADVVELDPNDWSESGANGNTAPPRDATDPNTPSKTPWRP